MKTECTPEQLEFHGLGKRQVIGKFDGGKISSDGGALLLRELEERLPIINRLAQCFTDYRNHDLVEHDVVSLLKQRIYAIALGYEDLNDHDVLRLDPLLALACNKSDPEGKDRARPQDQGKALAGKSTLNRLELGNPDNAAADRYRKITADAAQIDALMVDLFIDSFDQAPTQIILDIDATDDPVHGEQEGRFFHGYYQSYCYLPLYIFCGEQLLCARLRPANQDGAAGTVEELAPLIATIRQAWPEVQIILRGDSGFCRDAIMSWCEENQVDYVLGLAKNNRLNKAIDAELYHAQALYEKTEKAARVFRDFTYQTQKSWSRERRVIGKAEYLSKGANPRFIVTSLSPQAIRGRQLYEKLYCARGDMENRIKEQQQDLFADRTSSHTMASNQLRLYFSSFAYIVLQTLRRIGLKGTSLAKAQCGTIRLRLLKVGAQIRISTRKIWIACSESYPYAAVFEQVLSQLQRIPRRC
jgi:hypothetical protein